MRTIVLQPVLKHYRYFTGIYHFFGSFPEWYGTKKIGMVFLIFGSTSSGQRRFDERRGESSSLQASATRIGPDSARLECKNIPHWPCFSCFYFRFATDPPEFGQFRAGHRPADESFAPLSPRFAILAVGGDLAGKWYFYHQKVVLTACRFPSLRRVRFPRTPIPV